MHQKVNIGSGEDAPFTYEPSSHHTYESFKQRQAIRAARAANTIEGSVNEALPPVAVNAPPAVIYLRDESGFGPADQCVEVAKLDQDYTSDYCGC